MKLVAALAAGVLALALSGSASAQKVEKFDANSEWGWEGELKYDNGKLDLCSVQSQYEDKSIVIFMLSRERDFMMGVVSPDWALEKDSEAPISYWVDGNEKFKGVGKAVASNAVFVVLPQSDKLFEQLRQGNKLNFDYRKENFWYGLKGTRKALEALWNCVDRGLANETR